MLWSDSMQAGLASSQSPGQLLIALEPEAASIHIRRLRMHQLVPEKPVKRPLSIRRDDNEYHVDLDRVSSKFNNSTSLCGYYRPIYN